MKLRSLKLKSLFLVAGVLLIAGCNTGTSLSNSSQQPISVPLLVFESEGQIKYYSYTSAGGGKPGKTVIDTGSDVYYVSRSSLGPNVQYTNQSVILYYDFGQRSVPGTLAYASVTMYAGDTPVLTSSVFTPIVVIESENATPPFIGLMGVGMRGNLSPDLFFPEPYNQAISVNLPEATVSFGIFNQTINSNGASFVQLKQQVCNNYGTPLESSSATCWDTFAIPVQSTFLNGESTYTAPIMNGLIDSGSDSGFQLDPFPSYIESANHYTTNFAYATIQTSTGPLQMFMTPKVYAATSSFNGGNFVNIGNNVFNYYQIIFNRYDGKVWFKAPVQ